jgi:hypothetical protein
MIPRTGNILRNEGLGQKICGDTDSQAGKKTKPAFIFRLFGSSFMCDL